ncbi:hypothetical protein IFM89_009114 [Coptis chinensis]|uniref:Helicase ATP-binding domain-containing protein n=1 Tax=Coptis chinensis TaxID=261450 RepID=A0A835HWQ7_9MAGN|nr:hypothetical protein IFM89_009114 [Coptis chinensis]
MRNSESRKNEKIKNNKTADEESPIQDSTLETKKDEKKKKKNKHKKSLEEEKAQQEDTPTEAANLKRKLKIDDPEDDAIKKKKSGEDDVEIGGGKEVFSHAWPFLLDGRDFIGIVATGSGKTLAFGVPALMHIRRTGRKKRLNPLCLVLSPTRELAQQIANVLCEAGKSCGVSSVCVYGGTSKGPQISSLKAGVDIVIGTPGRLKDLIEMGFCCLKEVLEEIRLGLELNDYSFQQRRIAHMCFLGELYNYEHIDSSVIFETLYLILAFGHGTSEV